jgi:hypothetical protein
MLLASALIIPIGISYATYGDSPAFTTGAPTAQPVTNQTMTPTNSTVSPPVMSKSSMLSPLQQVKSGVAPKDVQCKTGLSLIFKAEDGSPACVNPDVATILAQRGW